MKPRTPLLVGLLVIAAIAAFVFTFGSLERGMSPDESYTVFARFDDASGLAPGSRITLAGIEVGQLGTPTLDPDDPTRARVPLVLNRKVELRQGIWDAAQKTWRNGATAVRRQSSLIGDYEVTITPGLEGETIAADGEVKNAISDSGISAVISKVESSSASIFPKLDRITDDISKVTASLRESLGNESGTAALGKIRDDVAKTTENVAALTTELRTFLKDSVYPRGDNVERILSSLEKASGDLATATAATTGRLDRILARFETMSGALETFIADQTADPANAKPGTVPELLGDLDEKVATFGDSLENLKGVTGALNRGEGTLGRLLKDDKLVTDIERVVTDVSDLTATIGRTRIGLQFRADYLADAGSFKSIVDFRFQTTPDKFYLLQIVDDPLGRSRRFTRTTVSNDPSQPAILTEEVVREDSGFKVSAQFAKRWHHLTFRYGILESTGGLGVDLTLFDDTLWLQTDLFDFGRDDLNPRLRFLAQWEFLPHFVLTGGLDDTLNAARDWFIGLGVRFDDSDLKGLLPFLPSP